MANLKITPFYHSLSGNTEEDKKLLEPFKYILQCGEKHLCMKLMPALNHWFQVSSDKLQEIYEIINIFYNACLLIDDIQDNSILRDNFPVAHSIYGLCCTINATNYVTFVAFEKAINLHPAAIKILIEEIIEFYQGQGMDMYWKTNFICPTEKDYRIMAIRKCGWFMKLIIRLMKLFSTYDGDFSSLINVVGLYYQIQNDYCNLCFDEDTNDISYCDDITEGKFSFLIIHALTSNPDDKQIINILKQRTTDINTKRYCVKLLKNFGSFKYTRDVLEELNKMVRIEIKRLGNNPLFVKILDDYENKISKMQVCESLTKIKN